MKLTSWTNSMREGETAVESFMAALESILISVVGRVGLWLAPLPSALLVSRSASRVFDLTGYWPVIMAAIVELVGLATSHLWLTAKEWNRDKNKTDPEANEGLAFWLMLAYFFTTGVLLLAFELPVLLTTGNATGLTALLFPALSAVAVIALNERAQQHKRAAAKVFNKVSKDESKSVQVSRKSVQELPLMDSETLERKLSEFEELDTRKGTKGWNTLRVLVWERDGRKCRHCNAKLSIDSMFHCHHLQPEALGGKWETV